MMDEPKKSTKSKNKTKSSSSSSKTAKDGKEKEEYSSEFLRQKLREFFNHSDFKSTLQKDAIKEIMRGEIVKFIWAEVFVNFILNNILWICFDFSS